MAMEKTAYSELIAAYESVEGYPSERWIERFESLKPTDIGVVEAAAFLTRDIKAIAATISCLTVRVEDGEDELFGKPVKHVAYHTGGWSGAEDLTEAMLKQFWIKQLHTKWERGGHFYFEVPMRLLPETP